MSKEYDGERFIPQECEGEIVIEHLQRYEMFKQLVKGKVVLDAACGEGYGSNILSSVAEKVVGLDIDDYTVERANNMYGNEKLKYQQGSIEKLPFEDKMFDVIISFETIEHVGEEIQGKFLKEIKRVLKKDGILIISTPNKRVYTDLVLGENKFHIKEFYVEEYKNFLSDYFSKISYFYQYPNTGYFLSKEDEDIQITAKGISQEDSRYVIAVCSDSEHTVDLEARVTFDDSMYYFLHKHAHTLENTIISMKKETDQFEKKQEDAIEGQKKHIEHLENTIDLLYGDIKHRDTDINSLNEAIRQRDTDINSLNEAIKQRDTDITSLNEAITHQDITIADLKQFVNKLTEENKELKAHPIRSYIRNLKEWRK